MKPPPFDYVVARSVADATAALTRYGGDAKLLAGGQSLMPMLNFRMLAPRALIDINRIETLNGVAELASTDEIHIGASTRHCLLQTHALVRTHCPIICTAMDYVAHVAIRNRGTIGGSLCHADPAAELPMVMRLLDATFDVAGTQGERAIPASEFFSGPLETTLGEHELLTRVRINRLPTHHGWGFAEVARRAGDFAIAAAGALIEPHAGRIRRAQIALTGLGPKPVRAEVAESMLAGERPTPALFDAAADAVRAVVTPESDVHASADYRRHLAGVLARRVLREAAQCCQ